MRVLVAVVLIFVYKIFALEFQQEVCMSRAVTRLIKGMSVSDGAGVRLKRTIGGMVDNIDPFLLLDEFKSDTPTDYLSGFPDHPHRGFETVTYMLAGSMEHRDHKGNRGLLTAGSVQWMTAGRGIVHSEMPKQDNGLMWGFQLWVNLPAKHKMIPPRYQDIPPDQIPKITKDGVEIVVVAGEVDGTKGPVSGISTDPTYLDINVPAGAKFAQPVPEQHAAFVYVFVGEGKFGSDGQVILAGNLGVLGEGNTMQMQASESSPCRFLLIAGKPIKEPIVRRGPFVMNTQAELMQAFLDYQSGQLMA